MGKFPDVAVAVNLPKIPGLGRRLKETVVAGGHVFGAIMRTEINGMGPSKTVIRSERIHKALIDWRVPRDRVDRHWPNQ